MLSGSNQVVSNEVESFIPSTNEESTRNEPGPQESREVAPNLFLRMMHDVYDTHLMVNSTVPQPQSAHHQGSSKQCAHRVTMYKVRKCDPCSVHFF